MDAKELAAEMQRQISDMKAGGTAAIYCDTLIEYLDRVKNTALPEPSERELKTHRHYLQSRMEHTKQVHESQMEMFRSVIIAGQGAIKIAMLLSGGASVALLAFLGHLAEVNIGEIKKFAFLLFIFSFISLGIAVLAGLTYLSQWFYAGGSAGLERIGFYLNVSCILLGIGLYVGFAWGLFETYEAFSSYSPPPSL